MLFSLVFFFLNIVGGERTVHIKIKTNCNNEPKTLSLLELSAQETHVNTYHMFSVPVYGQRGCRTAVALFRDF